MKKILAWTILVVFLGTLLGFLCKLLAERDAFGIAGAILLGGALLAAALAWALKTICKP